MGWPFFLLFRSCMNNILEINVVFKKGWSAILKANTIFSPNFMTMSHFDLRYAIPILINTMIKPQSRAMPWDWDPFKISNPQYWTNKPFLLVFLLLFFPFTSIQLSLPPPSSPNDINTNSALIRFQLGNFSLHLAVSLLGSLIFPQALFWYAYPTILIFAFCYPKLLFFLRRFVGWLNSKLSAFPALNLHISSTLTNSQAEVESHVPIPPVVIDFSTEV